MKNPERSRWALRWSAALLVLCCTPPAAAFSHRSESWATSQFTTAERAREALNGRPVQERNRREYQHVITAYRRVYFGAPTSTKADPSVVAVAELLVEMGRQFDDDKILKSAIDQYRFLRREYPGSKYRFDALFTIGEIYKDDLNDSAQARNTFEEFVRRYPRNHLADDARQALAEPVQQAALKTKDKPAANNSAASAPDQSAQGQSAQDQDDDSTVTSTSSKDNTATVSKTSKFPRVTSIRHWSTPDYTRVAIDLEQDVKFESQRIAQPDRIFFDLQNTKLASTLVGKTFDVDDGLLKKIRVAQFKPGKTRVVLEVEDLSTYDAFLLPNPSRLIIDIHGDTRGRDASQKTVAKAEPAANSAGESESAATTPDVKPESKTKKAEPSSVAAKQDKSVTASKQPAALPKPQTKTLAVQTGNTTASASQTTPPTKKIVEADDDDAPVVAKLDPPAPTPPSTGSGTKSATPTSPSGESTAARGTSSKSKRKSSPGPDIREAVPTANGDRSLIRALGLKIGKIVIDPGHGGHDTGTIGPNGLEEKDLVVDVGRRLGKLLQTRMGAEVVYTRSDDTFIPLETRTAIANQEQADLFVSIHANSSSDPDARGVETYYLNFTSSSEALEVAARENAVSDKSIHELQDLVKKIALKEKIEESHEFASDVQQALHSGLSVKNAGLRDRGVKKAPFIVLIGANMPSILAEISFVSNPGDERKLKTPEYRQKIAESLYRGISKYVGGLGGVKVASKIDKGEGQ